MISSCDPSPLQHVLGSHLMCMERIMEKLIHKADVDANRAEISVAESWNQRGFFYRQIGENGECFITVALVAVPVCSHAALFFVQKRPSKPFAEPSG